MPCCSQCRGIREQFDRRFAERELRRYRRRGPNRSTVLLLDALRAAGTDGLTLLDVGGGIGAIHHRLLAHGVARATHLDASPGYIEAARGEARRLGHEDRVHFVEGDAVDLAPELPEADIVTLDRVICCYPDMPALVGATASRARRWYGVVYPRVTWWTELAFPVANAFLRVRRSAFRIFLHATEAVDAEIRRHGLERHSSAQTLLWQAVLYARV